MAGRVAGEIASPASAGGDAATGTCGGDGSNGGCGGATTCARAAGGTIPPAQTKTTRANHGFISDPLFQAAGHSTSRRRRAESPYWNCNRLTFAVPLTSTTRAVNALGPPTPENCAVPPSSHSPLIQLRLITETSVSDPHACTCCE